MAWTDQCKIEACNAVKNKADEVGSVRKAIKVVAKESDIPAGTLNRWYYPQKESDPKNEVTPPSDIEQIYEKLQRLERFLKKKGIEAPFTGGEQTYGGHRVSDGPPKWCIDADSKIAWKASALFSSFSMIIPDYLHKHIPEKPKKVIPPAPEVTAADFEEKVIHSENPVVVDFYMPGCGPCRALSPTIDKLAQQYPGRKRKPVKIFKCKDPKIITSLQIKYVPHLSIYKNGARHDVETGVRALNDIKAEITRMIKDAA